MTAAIAVRCETCERTAEFDPYLFPQDARDHDWRVKFDGARVVARCSACDPQPGIPLRAADVTSTYDAASPGAARARELFMRIADYEKIYGKIGGKK